MVGRFPLHRRALSIALAEYERGVEEHPPGSNTGPRIREYQAATWLGGTGWPWCVAFALWCWREAGYELPYRGAGAWAYLDWARKAGWAVSGEQAIPGDLVVFSFGSGHLALLRQPVSGGEVKTVDGNVDDAVRLRTRPLSTVRGFVHIPEKPVPAPAAKPPLFEVVGSASGKRVIYVSGARAIGRRLPVFLRRHPVLTIRRKP